MSSTNDATQLVTRLAAGEARAADELLPLVYSDLRQRARSYLARERADHPLQATGLVHEAYLELVDQTRVDWMGKTHFMAVASLAMRRLLCDIARKNNRQKRGAGWNRVTLSGVPSRDGRQDLDLEALQEALELLAELNPRRCEVVEMKFFGGLTTTEISAVLGISERSVERDWRFARAWIFAHIKD